MVLQISYKKVTKWYTWGLVETGYDMFGKQEIYHWATTAHNADFVPKTIPLQYIRGIVFCLCTQVYRKNSIRTAFSEGILKLFITSCCILGMTWEYISIVTLIDEWTNLFQTSPEYLSEFYWRDKTTTVFAKPIRIWAKTLQQGLRGQTICSIPFP